MIREHLVRAAEAVTAGSVHPSRLEGPWEAWRSERHRRFLQVTGLDRHLEADREPPAVRVAQRHARAGYRIECLSYESLPGLWVAANLYLPDAPGRAPAILYLCGHSDLQKASAYQAHARRYAQLGFVTLIVDTVQLGEVRGFHHGTYGYGLFHWISRGYTPLAVEAWNGIRGLDLLSARPEVDASRLGVTGTSGGGSATWAIAAADERVAAASPSCSTGTIASHVRDRSLDHHCDCAFPANPDGSSLVDVAALVAPRPVLVVAADRDELFEIGSVRDFLDRLGRVYDFLGANGALGSFIFRGPHSYSPESRRETFAWFLRRLQGREVPPNEIEDVDDADETAPTLAAFPDGPPAGDRSTTVHDWFLPRAERPVIESAEDHARERARVVRDLHDLAFATFPRPLPHPRPRGTSDSWLKPDVVRRNFTYESEAGVRLRARLDERRGGSPEALALELAHPDERRALPTRSLLDGLPESWMRGALAPRGTGDTSWSPAQAWHLRRAAALTGRTLASLRVLDAVQGLRAVRELAGEAGRHLYVAARGEMALVALYAALLDGEVEGLLLSEPPASQDVAGAADGSGPCLEIWNALRVTDVAGVAGLVWPTRVIFVGIRPDAYAWAEEVHARLGPPGGTWSVAATEFWRPPARADADRVRVHVAREATP